MPLKKKILGAGADLHYYFPIELTILFSHTIVANGYNLGRDWLVEQALAGSELWIRHGGESPAFWVPQRDPTTTPTPAPEESETTSPEGWPWPGTGGERLRWRAEVEWVSGLLAPGRRGASFISFHFFG